MPIQKRLVGLRRISCESLSVHCQSQTLSLSLRRSRHTLSVSPLRRGFHRGSIGLSAVHLLLSLLHRCRTSYVQDSLSTLYVSCMTKSMEQARITFRLPQIEYDRLEAYSKRTGRTKTDILREFIRTLPESESEPEPEKK